MKPHMRLVMLAMFFPLVTACASGVENVRGQPSTYEDPQTEGRVSGVGIESQDVIAMTDEMMRDILATGIIAGRSTPPRIIIDNEYMRNESSSIINTTMLTDRLRVGLNRASEGRIIFVGRHFADMVEHERELKREGVVDGGTIRQAQAQAGADYRLGGRIMSLDAVDRDSQARSRYHQITFEMMDLELGTIVWSGMYEMRRSSQDNIMYR